MSAAPGSRLRVRAILGGGAALVALAVAAIFWMTRAGPDAGAGSSAGGPGPQPGATPAPAAALAVPAAAQQPSAAPSEPPAPQAWKDVPMAARLADLGPTLARPVYDGLRSARTAMEPCFQAEEKDQAAHPRARDAEAWGPAILTLQLEGRPGELVVVNAPLQELGNSSTSLVECCEGVLRGFRIPAPSAIPGKRYRLQHQLVQ